MKKGAYTPHGKGCSTGTPCKISDKFLLLQDFGQISWLAGRKKNLCLIEWYGEGTVPPSHCFALIKWYGEGTVPPSHCFALIKWYGEGTVPPSHCFALIKWYGEGTVPPSHCFALIKWYGEGTVPPSHCFALIKWYGEGAVPPTECFLRQVWVTVRGTVPPLYQASEIYSFLLFHLFTLLPLTIHSSYPHAL